MLSIIRVAHTDKKAVPGITLFKVLRDDKLVQYIFILDEIANDFENLTKVEKPVCPYCRDQMRISYHEGIEEDCFYFWECSCMDYDLKKKISNNINR